MTGVETFGVAGGLDTGRKMGVEKTMLGDMHKESPLDLVGSRLNGSLSHIARHSQEGEIVAENVPGDLLQNPNLQGS